MMSDVQKQLETHKKALDKDPLDVTALSELYDMYAQIGQAEKVKPFVDKALARWNKLYKGKSTEEQRRMLAGIALLALQADDLPTAADVLKVYHAEEPDNLGLIATLGNIYFELEQEPEAIEWYDKYLERTTPEEQGNDYWNILVDQATMYLHQSKGDASSPNYKEALTRLERATAENPQHWPAWYNLGEAHKAAGKKDAALAAYRKSLEVAGDDAMRKWESQKEINALEGKPPPPQPEVDPHAGLDMGGSSGLPTPPAGTPNPHGEMGGGM
jgi:tetratricopeptide (TPR) repeat protein